MFKRVIKTLAALVAGHGVQTLTQFLLPPAFIAAYGIEGYGEWLALSAAVGYLGTLDFGLQTYVLNRLTTLYHQRELDEFHRVQSVGLWLMLGFVIFGSAIACLAFVLPVQHWLRIIGPAASIKWTVFWLGLQILAGIPLGQVLGVYRTFGQAHRGVMWGNAYRVLHLVVTLVIAILRAPLWLIAFAQFLTVFGVLATVFVWLRRTQPKICPRLDYWRKDLALQILKPSSFFGLFMLNNFLVYQAPVLLLQRFLGPQPVVVFSIARTLFSFVRQGTGLLQQAIAPEITRLDGLGDRDKLARLYVLFESVLFSLVLVVNAGLLLLTPALLAIWVKRPQLFDLWVFTQVMLVSILVSIKEYKLYFQCATNNHVRTGLVTSLAYAAMLLASVPAIRWLGVKGFVLAWLCAEAVQIVLIHSYNREFFDGRREISLRLALRCGLVLMALVAFVATAQSFLQSHGYLMQAAIAVLAAALLMGISFFLFGIRQHLAEWKPQLIRIRREGLFSSATVSD
jgi:O-antigen/teichoic acid export membrane protein